MDETVGPRDEFLPQCVEKFNRSINKEFRNL